MDKRLTIFITVVALCIIGGITYLLTSSADTSAVKDAAEQSQANTSPTPAVTPTQASTGESGVYANYSEAALAETGRTKLLFFHASWCPQCRALEADIIQKGVPTGVTILKIDYDSNQKLRQKYGVTLQTTLVKVDEQGNTVEKYVSYDEPTLAAVKRNLL